MQTPAYLLEHLRNVNCLQLYVLFSPPGAASLLRLPSLLAPAAPPALVAPPELEVGEHELLVTFALASASPAVSLGALTPAPLQPQQQTRYFALTLNRLPALDVDAVVVSAHAECISVRVPLQLPRASTSTSSSSSSSPLSSAPPAAPSAAFYPLALRAAGVSSASASSWLGEEACVLRANNSAAASKLSCRFCGAPVVRDGVRFARVLPLPSPFWHELSDLWICHKDYFDAVPRHFDAVRATPRLCMLGEAYLLLHADDLLLSPLSTHELVRCARCECPLGEADASASAVADDDGAGAPAVDTHATHQQQRSVNTDAHSHNADDDPASSLLSSSLPSSSPHASAPAVSSSSSSCFSSSSSSSASSSSSSSSCVCSAAAAAAATATASSSTKSACATDSTSALSASTASAVLPSSSPSRLTGVRLFKHRIALRRSELFRRHSAETACSALMLDASDSHNIRHFGLVGRDSGCVYALLHLFGWHSSVTTNLFAWDGCGDASASTPVVKVLFLDCCVCERGALKPDEATDAIQLWEGRHCAEMLLLPDDECVLLRSLLVERNALLPPAIRSLSQMRLAFLRRMPSDIDK